MTLSVKNNKIVLCLCTPPCAPLPPVTSILSLYSVKYIDIHKKDIDIYFELAHLTEKGREKYTGGDVTDAMRREAVEAMEPVSRALRKIFCPGIYGRRALSEILKSVDTDIGVISGALTPEDIADIRQTCLSLSIPHSVWLVESEGDAPGPDKISIPVYRRYGKSGFSRLVEFDREFHPASYSDEAFVSEFSGALNSFIRDCMSSSQESMAGRMAESSVIQSPVIPTDTFRRVIKL
jgi:hypothetical protein